MAQTQIGNHLGVAASGTTNKNLNGGATPGAGLKNTNIVTIDDARARLTAVAPGSYPTKVLDTMTFNDMIYAIRLLDNPTSIKQ